MNAGSPVGNNGRFRLGLGTGSLREGSHCRSVVKSALKVGYRHIDTARHYENESAIGDALEQSLVPRSDVFIATKVHSTNLASKDVRKSVYKSLASLDVETIDLVYVHWPAHSYDPEETLSALSDLRSEGLIRHIGLCNVTVDVLKEARRSSTAPIFAIQVEMHPFLQQRELHAYARKHGIWVVAHTPLCQGKVLENETLSAIADSYEINEAQLTLAWLMNKERVAAVPGGSHLNENRLALSVELCASDIRKIEGISEERRCVDYEFAPWS